MYWCMYGQYALRVVVQLSWHTVNILGCTVNILRCTFNILGHTVGLFKLGLKDCEHTCNILIQLFFLAN